MSEMVYWFENGRVLHGRANCPALGGAVVARLHGGVGPRLLSRDMAEDDLEGRQPYPPEELELCSRCSR